MRQQLYSYINEPGLEKTSLLGFRPGPTQTGLHTQKKARILKFWVEVEEELYYPSSENKDTDQLRGYREADLRLCFGLCRLMVFPRGGSNMHISKQPITLTAVIIMIIYFSSIQHQFCPFEIRISVIII